ncbi:hypothetical protein PFISCL1PPCAC_12145, partial [Pristionchus fissidentatus]
FQPFGGIELSQDSIEWVAKKKHEFNSSIVISLGDVQEDLIWYNALTFHRSAAVRNMGQLMAQVNVSTVEVSW